jgi:hypothetical protein
VAQDEVSGHQPQPQAAELRIDALTQKIGDDH